MSDIPYYNMDKIDNEGCNWNIIFGERSNGKSYQVKHKKGIQPFFDSIKDAVEDATYLVKSTIRRFALVRRTMEEFKGGRGEEYFKDVDFNKISNGLYQGVQIYKGRIYLTKWSEKDLKFYRSSMYIGYVMALNIEQNYAGGSYLDIYNIIFEEFMSRKIYLNDEPSKLMSLYATIDRKRGTTRVWLLGNTISRVCPYLKEWGLQNVIARMKQGEIYIHEITVRVKDNLEKIKIAVEYCRSTNKSSYTFGDHAGMMNSGEWQTDAQPLLPGSYKDYRCLYRIVFYYKGFKFLGEFLSNKKTHEVCWFIRPKYNKIKKNTIVFSDEINISRLWQRNIYNLSFQNDRITEILSYFRESMIFYSNDLVGTDFKQAIDFEIRR